MGWNWPSRKDAAAALRLRSAWERRSSDLDTNIDPVSSASDPPHGATMPGPLTRELFTAFVCCAYPLNGGVRIDGDGKHYRYGSDCNAYE